MLTPQALATALGLPRPTDEQAAVVADVLTGVPAAVIGARFHCAVADLVAGVAASLGHAHRTVALSGGVWQNALLLHMTRAALRDRGFAVLTHRQVPPNDGGIALGQLLVGTAG